MPVRNGRWISLSKIEAEKVASASVEADEPAEVEQKGAKPKRKPRNAKAAEAAIADATGVAVTIDGADEPAESGDETGADEPAESGDTGENPS